MVVVLLMLQQNDSKYHGTPPKESKTICVCRLNNRLADLFPQVSVFSKGLDLLDGLVSTPAIQDGVRDAVVSSAAQAGIALGTVKPVAFMVSVP
jgi:hypothetical protein